MTRLRGLGQHGKAQMISESHHAERVKKCMHEEGRVAEYAGRGVREGHAWHAGWLGILGVGYGYECRCAWEVCCMGIHLHVLAPTCARLAETRAMLWCSDMAMAGVPY